MWFNLLFKDRNLRRYVIGDKYNWWMIDRNDNSGFLKSEITRKLDKSSIMKCDDCKALFEKNDIYEVLSVVSRGKEYKNDPLLTDYIQTGEREYHVKKTSKVLTSHYCGRCLPK